MHGKQDTYTSSQGLIPIRQWGGHVTALANGLLASLVFVFSGAAAFAQGISWQEAIEHVEASAEGYRQAAIERGTSWAGTMYAGYNYDLHRCAILGRMLDQYQWVADIEQFDYPPLDNRTDPHDLLVFSISLDNWVSAARWAVDASESERINRWNLDCVGAFGIPRLAFLESERPEAAFERDGQWLRVYGDIEPGFFQRFQRALDANPDASIVVLGSGGGSVRDAILAGAEIRRRGLETTLHGNCYSACPLVFVGGVRRVLWASPHRLGFHQISIDRAAVDLDHPIYSVVARYLASMGVEPVTVISWMFSASPAEMFEPEVGDLCRPGVATFVQRICGWD